METEYREHTIGVSRKYTEQISVETSVNAAERGGVAKVLSLESETKLIGVEMMAGEARVSGKVNYRLLYLDGSEKPCGLDYFKDFEAGVEGEEIAVGGKWRTELTVVDSEARVSGDTVTLTAIVEITLYVYAEKTSRGIAAVSGAETLAGRVQSEVLAGKREIQIDLMKEESVGALVKKVLLFDAVVAVYSVNNTEAGYTVTGETRASVLYMTEEGNVTEKVIALPFSEEVEKTAEKVSFAISVKSARIVISGDENISSYEVEASVVLTAYDSEMRDEECVQEVFSPACLLEEERERFVSEFSVGENYFKTDLTGVISVTDAEKCVGVRPVGLAIANVSAQDGIVRVEGVTSYNAICLSGDTYSAAQGELPFVCEFPFAEAKVGQRATATVTVLSAEGKLSSEGVAVSASVAVTVSLYDKEESSFVKEIREGAPREDDGSGISVYFAEAGEELWHISKNMGVAPSSLLQANPFLSEPLTEAKKVLVFKSKYAEE